MKNRWFTLILVVSLAFNLAIAASFIYRKFFYKELKPQPTIEFKTSFKLTPDQTKNIGDRIKKFKIQSINFKEDILNKRIEIIEEMGKPDFNSGTIDEKVQELNQLENQLNSAFIGILLEINEILDSGQRLILLYQLSKDWYFLDRFSEKGGQYE